MWAVHEVIAADLRSVLVSEEAALHTESDLVSEVRREFKALRFKLKCRGRVPAESVRRDRRAGQRKERGQPCSSPARGSIR